MRHLFGIAFDDKQEEEEDIKRFFFLANVKMG